AAQGCALTRDPVLIEHSFRAGHGGPTTWDPALATSPPLPLAGEVGARSAPGEGGAQAGDRAIGRTTLIRLRHLLPPAGEGKANLAGVSARSLRVPRATACRGCARAIRARRRSGARAGGVRVPAPAARSVRRPSSPWR